MPTEKSVQSGGEAASGGDPAEFHHPMARSNRSAGPVERDCDPVPRPPYLATRRAAAGAVDSHSLKLGTKRVALLRGTVKRAIEDL